MTTIFLTTFSLATVEAWVIALLPALTAVGTIFFSLYKICKYIAEMKSKYQSLEQAVNDKTELTAVKTEMDMIVRQTAVLQKEIADLITAQSKVKYDVSNNKEE